MKILITGAAGQLGSALKRALAVHPGFKGAVLDEAARSCFDLRDFGSASRWFSKKGPYDLVLHCAAMTNVDLCEKDPEGAKLVNASAAGFLAGLTQDFGGRFVFLSTDQVFSGDQSSPYRERDQTGPVNAYGASKLLGEKLVQKMCAHSLIIRTSWLYSASERNFVSAICRASRLNTEISVVTDQISCPTYAPDLARAILKLCAQKAFGTYHCAGSGCCSKFDFAREILKLKGAPCRALPITSRQYAQKTLCAPRPVYSALDCGALQEDFGIALPAWTETLKNFFYEERPHAGN